VARKGAAGCIPEQRKSLHHSLLHENSSVSFKTMRSCFLCVKMQYQEIGVAAFHAAEIR